MQLQGKFQGKIALVTGGSRGMGREMVRAFAADGADVVIASRKLANCQQVADEVTTQYGIRALPVEVNVSDWDACGALVDQVYAEFGKVDILVNNAGLSPMYPSLGEVTEALFDKVIAVNLRGPFRLTALIGERMAAGDGGAILNISSVEAWRPQAHALPYAAAKRGLDALTEGFAQAFGPTVRVNGIQCGAFLTDISHAWSAEAMDRLSTTPALKRAGAPEEIVGAAMYFCSDDASFATGATLRLDGGWQ